MVLTGARRSLPGLVNSSIVTIPDVFRIVPLPSAGMAVLNAFTKPTLNKQLLVGEFPGAQTGVRARSGYAPGKARSILVVHATHVARRTGNPWQIHALRRGLNPSMFGIRPLMTRFPHVNST